MSSATDSGEPASSHEPKPTPSLADSQKDGRRHWSESAANGIARKNGPVPPIKIPEDIETGSKGPSIAVNGVTKPASAREPSHSDGPRKLPAEKLLELVSGTDSLPMHVEDAPAVSPTLANQPASLDKMLDQEQWHTVTKKGHARKKSGSTSAAFAVVPEKAIRSPLTPVSPAVNAAERLLMPARTASNPTVTKAKPSKSTDKSPLPSSEQRPLKPSPMPLDIKDAPKERRRRKSDVHVPSPLPSKFPLPPMSLATHLRLELSSSDPSPLYIYRTSNRDFPYEPSRVKLERLTNFLLLPPQLEETLWFGTLACLDSWLYTFTLLPLRFVRALYVLSISWSQNAASEIQFITAFIYEGLGRVWRRQHQPPSQTLSEKKKARRKSESHSNHPLRTPIENGTPVNGKAPEPTQSKTGGRHRYKRSEPSKLLPVDKADILKGLLIISSCVILMYFDASMMYHSIRGQAAIKLYVIYNALEVFDRLLAALGQDVLECLFSPEALERHPNGRSKILRPLGLFLLALVYNITHAIALFYQVITLNVAVNSYSNALFTLLMSNQFVEIKSTVFKRFEKENLFQMTCADIVERFQLWLMLMIIASRNIIETNNIFGDGNSGEGGSSSSPLRAPSILPFSFTILPSWVGQVMAPFFLVLGIEMLVDWVKHAYITKFNNTKPNIYGRFLDVLAKDYYTQAFAGQDLTKRLGLPLIPLSCLFIRAAVQTYSMFLDTHLPLPLPSRATSLSESHPDPSQSPATTAEMLQLPQLLRRVLGRHVPADAPAAPVLSVPYLPFSFPSADTLIALISTGVFFALLFALLLAMKLLLGMALLAYARRRYMGMKAREALSTNAEGRRVGGWGTVEVDEDKRRWIYDDDPEGLKKLWEKESRDKEKGGKSLGSVERYSMVAKRIW